MNDDEFVNKVSRLIAEREVVANRWTLGLMALYFFGTLATVWVLVGTEIAPLREQLARVEARLAGIEARLK